MPRPVETGPASVTVGPTLPRRPALPKDMGPPRQQSGKRRLLTRGAVLFRGRQTLPSGDGYNQSLVFYHVLSRRKIMRRRRDLGKTSTRHWPKLVNACPVNIELLAKVVSTSRHRRVDVGPASRPRLGNRDHRLGTQGSQGCASHAVSRPRPCSIHSSSASRGREEHAHVHDLPKARVMQVPEGVLYIRVLANSPSSAININVNSPENANSFLDDADMPAQQTRYLQPMLFYCWASVRDAGPTIKRHWLNISCLLGEGVLTSRCSSAILCFSDPSTNSTGCMMGSILKKHGCL